MFVFVVFQIAFARTFICAFACMFVALALQEKLQQTIESDPLSNPSSGSGCPVTPPIGSSSDSGSGRPVTPTRRPKPSQAPPPALADVLRPPQRPAPCPPPRGVPPKARPAMPTLMKAFPKMHAVESQAFALLERHCQHSAETMLIHDSIVLVCTTGRQEVEDDRFLEKGPEASGLCNGGG